jgi:uncharacterized membrane protein YqjE
MDTESRSVGLVALLRRLCHTAIGALQNRVELAAVELQEERQRVFELFLLAGGALILLGIAVVLFSAAVVLMFVPAYRVYAAVGLGVLYLAGAIVLWLRIKSRLQSAPFSETVNQIRKDAEWLSPPK